MSRFFFALVFLLAGSLLRGAAPRVINLSSRSQAGAGNSVLISGFVVGGGKNTTVLIRAVGPTLSSYGITAPMPDPSLTLYDAKGAVLATNDNWNSSDAGTMQSVGAFTLPAGSRDAALVATLAPGMYSAMVNGTAGVALIEIYEVNADGTTAPLVNVSTRTRVGTGAGVLISGLVVGPGDGTRRLLVRAAGPALVPFGVTDTLSDPTITAVNSSGATIASNDDWSTPATAGDLGSAAMSEAFNAAGAFPFANGSADAALVADFAPGNYSLKVEGKNGVSGVSLLEVYDITPPPTTGGPMTVTVSASKAMADESGSNPGEFLFTRSGDTTTALVVQYTLGGSATNGTDYSTLNEFVTIPAGASSVKLPVTVLPDLQTESTETVTVRLNNGVNYTVGAQSTATVNITDNVAALYAATLRPETNATTSIASGTATIVVSSDGSLATVSMTFSNLSSSEVSAHLKLGTSDFVFGLPAGQVSSRAWTFSPTGGYTTADLQTALQNGQLFVGVDTADYPTGELRGTFVRSTGSQAFSAPAAPPALSVHPLTPAEAARFLTQATFGPKMSEIDALTGGSVDAWIAAQMALPYTSLRTTEMAEYAREQAAASDPTSVSNSNVYKQWAWFKNAINAPDQLRQRVAFALSELFVVSDAAFGPQHTEGLANFYDILGNGAFGNFRTVLDQVTTSPIMGLYLSSLRNAKASGNTSPDENYAREVMQLFTIGLNQLQPDGTLKLGADGQPIPTYNQATVTEMAKVFTGWAYYSTAAKPDFRSATPDYINPMMLYPAYHDATAKTIVGGLVLPANQDGAADLKAALDALFNHPNCGPFVCRQLIQRLVTSNPSPAYVYRVAQVFANNGSGVRGDLGAVVRAILTDYEARSSTAAANDGFGKLKEPLIRYTALLRAFNGGASSGRYKVGNTETQFLQGAQQAPTVFNFFEPGYVQEGVLAAAGLVAPEFQITNDATAIALPNYLRSEVFSSSTPAADTIVLDFTTEQTMVNSPAALVDRLNLILCEGNMNQAAKDRVVTCLNALPSYTSVIERARSAVILVVTSPASAIQR